jgi:hypothetical protein
VLPVLGAHGSSLFPLLGPPRPHTSQVAGRRSPLSQAHRLTGLERNTDGFTNTVLIPSPSQISSPMVADHTRNLAGELHGVGKVVQEILIQAFSSAAQDSYPRVLASSHPCTCHEVCPTMRVPRGVQRARFPIPAGRSSAELLYCTKVQWPLKALRRPGWGRGRGRGAMGAMGARSGVGAALSFSLEAGGRAWTQPNPAARTGRQPDSLTA